ncbi:MarR family transcriptional regulator [Phycicoccus endophyticus]|uniref:MarR family transcriptional regulator n=1 Tax=Phycicoccus endophyticus TaxID=1690220 RepID=A0A7G9R065_9MICO|nr:MarR family transcriptional regulator [Phycicoccus endophyticus]NHI20216.1 MarR family transcriptional regulator [Phycicoccus endophyticus]QNN48990.1 MarR family transcriptional regulator [Phycicoccus endophyticus]GGL44330.1 hypothetical transcriptional regulator, MarR [Phycicoccus endophyticus]
MRTDDVLEELLRSAAGLSRWASRHADLELPWAQARVLSLIEELGPARVTALAAADDTSQPTMTCQLQRLEAQGLAARTPDPADGRASLVSLTDAGHEALAGARRARTAALRPVLEDVGADPQRLHAVASLLTELVEAARRRGDPAA